MSRDLLEILCIVDMNSRVRVALGAVEASEIHRHVDPPPAMAEIAVMIGQLHFLQETTPCIGLDQLGRE